MVVRTVEIVCTACNRVIDDIPNQPSAKLCFTVSTLPLALNSCNPPQTLGREAMKMLLAKAVVGNGSDFTGSAFGKKKNTQNEENHSIASMHNIKIWTEVFPKLCALHRNQCNIKCLIQPDIMSMAESESAVN